MMIYYILVYFYTLNPNPSVSIYTNENYICKAFTSKYNPGILKKLYMVDILDANKTLKEAICVKDSDEKSDWKIKPKHALSL